MVREDTFATVRAIIYRKSDEGLSCELAPQDRMEIVGFMEIALILPVLLRWHDDFY